MYLGRIGTFLSLPILACCIFLSACGGGSNASTSGGGGNSTSGIITTVAGNGTTGYSGDNGLATSAALSSPQGVAVSSSGNFYFADGGNNRIRKVNISTGIITTVAGTGTPGYSGDNGPATSAALSSPQGVAVGSSGNIYFADGYRIRKVNISTGIITTVAGTGTLGYSGDNGPATSAEMLPTSVAVDSFGNIYLVDEPHLRIRKVDTSGIITTVAGDGTAGYSGDNGPATSAQLGGIGAVAVDSSGNFYIADNSNKRLRKVTVSTGIITTVAGNGTYSYSGDNGPATSAAISNAGGVAVDNYGNIYFSDNNNERIRKVNH